jgi:O-acetyl-ADP-ribose deacetylase (regulator of RNase III)
VIVNAADACIWFGDGVDGALRQRGGWDYIRACQVVARKYAPIPTGEVVFMPNRAKQLKCRYIAHAVSPSWQDKRPYSMLSELMIKVLGGAKRRKAVSIAVPILGSGAFRLDINKAYQIINSTINRARGRMVVLIVHPNFKLEY